MYALISPIQLERVCARGRFLSNKQRGRTGKERRNGREERDNCLISSFANIYIYTHSTFLLERKHKSPDRRYSERKARARIPPALCAKRAYSFTRATTCITYRRVCRCAHTHGGVCAPEGPIWTAVHAVRAGNVYTVLAFIELVAARERELGLRGGPEQSAGDRCRCYGIIYRPPPPHFSKRRVTIATRLFNNRHAAATDIWRNKKYESAF